MTPSHEPLIILGASARAAAQSAVRGGFSPYAADLFADSDLLAYCPARQVEDYPMGLAAAAREFPPGTWMYTGGLENHPALVERISAERPLLGNSAGVLRAVRDPLQFAAALRESSLSYLETSLAPLVGKLCLRKPRHSCGGARIKIWDDADLHDSGGAWYYQEFVPGSSASAVYVADGRQASLLGVTRQLVGEAWTGAAPFRYCGSLGPLALSDERRTIYERLGACLAERFELRGLFGVDVIENDAGIWPVEVNPRYTASVEILERAFSISAVALHVAACHVGWDQRLSGRAGPPSGISDLKSEISDPSGGPALASSLVPPDTRCHGKAVLYAQHDFEFGPEFAEFVAQSNEGRAWPAIADVPRIGTQIHSGQPVVSIFATAEDLDETVLKLRLLAKQTTSIGAHCGLEFRGSD